MLHEQGGQSSWEQHVVGSDERLRAGLGAQITEHIDSGCASKSALANEIKNNI